MVHSLSIVAVRAAAAQGRSPATRRGTPLDVLEDADDVEDVPDLMGLTEIRGFQQAIADGTVPHGQRPRRSGPVAAVLEDRRRLGRPSAW